MASITLKDVPKGLHQKLRSRAAKNRRSLNQEALACLELAVLTEPVNVEALLRKAHALQARARRSGVKPITDREIDAWINQGRP